MAKSNASAKSSHPKKELKKELADKIESVLPEMKTKLGEKKFHNRIKKAAKLIVHGLHDKDLSENNETENTNTAQPKKAKALKKAKAKSTN